MAVGDAAGLLLAIGQPWCANELRVARTTAGAAACVVLDDALARLAAPATAPGEPYTRVAIATWQWGDELGRLSPEARHAIDRAATRVRAVSGVPRCSV